MYGFSILMFIFATCVLLVGLYIYKKCKFDIMTFRAAFRNLTKDKWKNIGKWTMISSLFIYLLAILGLIFKL